MTDVPRLPWFDDFIYRIFWRPKRRKILIRHWLTTRHATGATLADVFQNILEKILFSTLRLTITNQYLNVFDKTPEMGIFYSWMTKEELSKVFNLLLYRKVVFRNYQKLSEVGGFVADSYVHNSDLNRLVNREGLARDFVATVLSHDTRYVFPSLPAPFFSPRTNPRCYIFVEPQKRGILFFCQSIVCAVQTSIPLTHLYAGFRAAFI